MLKLLLAAVACYAVLVLVVYLMQARMLYLPDVPGRTLDRTPADIGADYTDVSIRTSDGVRLHGWFLPGDSDRVLLFFHGNAGNISHRLESIRQFLRLGLSVLIIDYRGYGQSEGRATEQGIYRDAEAAWQYLVETKGTPEGRILLFGRSMGASAAAYLAAHHRPLALVVESSFTSVPDIAGEYYPWLPVRLLMRNRFDSLSRIRAYRGPLLQSHGTDDEIVPFAMGKKLFDAAAGEPRQFVPMPGVTHNGPNATDYYTELHRFFEQLR